MLGPNQLIGSVYNKESAQDFVADDETVLECTVDLLQDEAGGIDLCLLACSEAKEVRHNCASGRCSPLLVYDPQGAVLMIRHPWARTGRYNLDAPSLDGPHSSVAYTVTCNCLRVSTSGACGP